MSTDITRIQSVEVETKKKQRQYYLEYLDTDAGKNELK